MNERTESGKDWARFGAVVAVVVSAIIYAYGGDNWQLLVYQACIGLPILGWYFGLWLADKDAAAVD